MYLVVTWVGAYSLPWKVLPRTLPKSMYLDEGGGGGGRGGERGEGRGGRGCKTLTLIGSSCNSNAWP